MAFRSGGGRSIQLSYGRNTVDGLSTTAGVSGVMARPEGFEPPTYGFEARRSIQLSYGRAICEPTSYSSMDLCHRWLDEYYHDSGRMGRCRSSDRQRQRVEEEAREVVRPQGVQSQTQTRVGDRS